MLGLWWLAVLVLPALVVLWGAVVCVRFLVGLLGWCVERGGWLLWVGRGTLLGPEESGRVGLPGFWGVRGLVVLGLLCLLLLRVWGWRVWVGWLFACCE